MIELIQDFFTVEIETRYNETKTKSGIILVNTAWIDDQDGDRFQHKRIYGKVLSVPQSYSDNSYRAIDDGMPAYHKFVGHDDIVDRINRGYRNHAEKSYYCSTFERYNTVTMQDVAQRVDVQVGDLVYFLPQVTEDENMMEKQGDREIHKVCVTDIICAIRQDPTPDEMCTNWFPRNLIIMQGEWVLVRPNKESWEEITTKSGIIMKPNPEVKWLEGFVVHSRHDHLVPGNKIVYLPNSDAKVTVEGEEYYVMTSEDIVGKLK